MYTNDAYFYCDGSKSISVLPWFRCGRATYAKPGVWFSLSRSHEPVYDLHMLKHLIFISFWNLLFILHGQKSRARLRIWYRFFRDVSRDGLDVYSVLWEKLYKIKHISLFQAKFKTYHWEPVKKFHRKFWFRLDRNSGNKVIYMECNSILLVSRTSTENILFDFMPSDRAN